MAKSSRKNSPDNLWMGAGYSIEPAASGPRLTVLNEDPGELQSRRGGLMSLFIWLFKPMVAFASSKAWVSLFLVGVAITYTVHAYHENSDSIVLESLMIPAPLAAQGVTQEAAADMIRQSLNKAARSAVETKGFRNLARLNTLPDIEVPGLGMNLPKLFETIFFWLPARGTRVRGWIRCQETGCADGRLGMTLSIVNHESDKTAPAYTGPVKPIEAGRQPNLSGGYERTQPLQDLMDLAAREILRQTDPYVYAAIQYKESRGGVIDEHSEQAFVAASELASSGHPNAKYAHNLLGLIHKDGDQYELARESFMAALESDPAFGLAYHNLGNTMLDAGRYIEAHDAYRSALRRELSDHIRPWTLAFAGDALLRFPTEPAGSPQFAEVHPGTSSKLLRKRARDALRKAAGKLYHRSIKLAEGDKDDAAERHVPHPARGHALNNLALTLSWLGETEEALKTYARAAGSRPTHALTHLDWGKLLLHQNRLDRAGFVLRRAVDLYGNKGGAPKSTARAKIYLAKAYLAQGKFAEAFALGQEAGSGRTFKSDRARLYELVALSAQEIGKSCTAFDAIAKLAAIDERYVPKLEKLGSGPHPRCSDVKMASNS